MPSHLSLTREISSGVNVKMRFFHATLFLFRFTLQQPPMPAFTALDRCAIYFVDKKTLSEKENSDLVNNSVGYFGQVLSTGVSSSSSHSPRTPQIDR